MDNSLRKSSFKEKMNRSSSYKDMLDRSQCQRPFNLSGERFDWLVNPEKREMVCKQHCMKRHISETSLIKKNLNPSNLPMEESALHLKCNFPMKFKKTSPITSLDNRKDYVDDSYPNPMKKYLKHQKSGSIANLLKKTPTDYFMVYSRKKITQHSTNKKVSSVSKHHSHINSNNSVLVEKTLNFQNECMHLVQSEVQKNNKNARNSTSPENILRSTSSNFTSTSPKIQKRMFNSQCQSSQDIKELLVHQKKTGHNNNLRSSHNQISVETPKKSRERSYKNQFDSSIVLG